jgi:hypothetical protein
MQDTLFAQSCSFARSQRQRAPGEYSVLAPAAPEPTPHPRRKPFYRTVKAYLRAKRKEHNRRRWAAKGKIALLRPRGRRRWPKP